VFFGGIEPLMVRVSGKRGSRRGAEMGELKSFEASRSNCHYVESAER
jgi:hypothetical protein